MVYGNFAQINMTTKHKRTVLSIEDKITICEHLDKRSSKSEIASEYKVTVLSISCISSDYPNFLII